MSKETPEEISGSELEKIFADAIIPPSTRSRRNVKIVAKEAILVVDGKEEPIHNVTFDFGTAEKITPKDLQMISFMREEDREAINLIWLDFLASTPAQNRQIEKAVLLKHAKTVIGTPPNPVSICNEDKEKRVDKILRNNGLKK